MQVTERQKQATSAAIQRIAYYTAREATGKRQRDAIAHCERLGIDYTAGTFAEATGARNAL